MGDRDRPLTRLQTRREESSAPVLPIVPIETAPGAGGALDTVHVRGTVGPAGGAVHVLPPPVCGNDAADHEHDRSCFTTLPAACTIDSLNHEHEAACYDPALPTSCNDSSADHVHDATCFGHVFDHLIRLTCTNRRHDHVHDADCYAPAPRLACVVSSTGHIHQDECFEILDVRRRFESARQRGSTPTPLLPTEDRHVYDHRDTSEPALEEREGRDPVPVIPTTPTGSVMWDPRTYRKEHLPRPTVKSSPRSSLQIQRQALEAKRKQAELDAKLEMARLQEEIINARLAARIADIDAAILSVEDGERRSEVPSVRNWTTSSEPLRLQSQLSDAAPLVPRTSSGLSGTVSSDVNTLPVTPRVPAFSGTTSRPALHFEEATPARERSSDRRRARSESLEQLAEAITKMARPKPRQTYELPRFDGNPADWIAFKEMYDRSTENYSFADYENVARLQQALHGEAKAAVEDLLRTRCTPEEIINALEEEFGHPGAILECALLKIRNLPRVTDSARELKKFVTVVRNCVSLLKSVRADGYLNNSQLVSEVLVKLTPLQRKDYCQFVKQRDKETSVDLRVSPTLEVMLDFLVELSNTASYLAPLAFTTPRALIPSASERPRTSQVPRTIHHKVNALGSDTPTTADCAACHGKHDLPQCKKFQALDINARWNIVKDNKLCFKCILKKHSREFCRAKRCDKCRAPHHSLLHYERPPSQGPPRLEQPVESDPTTEQVTTVSGQCARSLLKIVPVTIVRDNCEVNTHALLDDGATVSLIDSELVPSVRNEPKCPLTIVTARGDKVTDDNSRQIMINLRGPNGTEHKVNVRTMSGLDLPSQSIPASVFKRNSHLCKLDCSDLDRHGRGEAKPMLLLGQDNWQLIVGQEVRQGKSGQPVASLTKLGWVIHGPLGSHCKVDSVNTINFINCVHVRDQDLHALVKSQFELESIGIIEVSRKNVEAERANQILEQTSRRVEDGWEVGLLWKRDNIEFPNNFEYAHKRLMGIERRMDRDPEFASAYEAQVNRLLSEGYAEKVESASEGPKWFLPHFGVTNPNKPGKLRLVFDAAATYKGCSLNSNLMSGPDCLNSLFGVLLKFRIGSVGFKGDIADMFLRVKIRQQDRNAQKFLWRGRDRTRNPEAYVMRSMIFGATSSPTSAIFLLNKNADEFKNTHSDAVEAIHAKHYMDDYLESVNTVDDALRLINDVTDIHAAGGFHIRGWVTNSPSLRAKLPTVQSSSINMETNLDEVPIERTLGLIWFPEEDCLGFDVSLKRIPEELINGNVTPTKREFLRIIMSVFDPLGFLCPAIIPTRILMQNIWRSGIGWDDKLLDREAQEWRKWIKNLDQIGSIRLPRWYNVSLENVELHVFGDASELAYAAVAYLVGTNDKGERHSVMVAGKARVAPVKVVSVPRLELQAAVLACRLANSVAKELGVPLVNKYLWTDSKTVLNWIKTDARDYKKFVSYRLSELERKSEKSDWRWVPSADNPADEATKLGWPREKSIWFRGPSFLCDPQELWPTQAAEEPWNTCEADTERVQSALTLVAREPPLIDTTRYSTWHRALRVTARIFAFVRRCQGRQTEALTMENLREAELHLLRQSQMRSFEPEILALRQGQALPRSSKLRALDPMLYNDGLLRIRGRLSAADELSFDERHPILLEGHEPLTRLLVHNYHVRGLHANPEQVVNTIRERFWVTQLRSTVKAVAAACQPCRLARAQPQIPKMADLPPDRLTSTRRAFVNCGVDYFGPMEIVVGRRREKRWGVLFTCLATRAVHLELASSLNIDSAIMAIRRLTARRGKPALMRSDRGTNFVGADNELRACLRELDHDGLAQKAENIGIKWIFNSPSAPHMGGVWERLVRSVKNALRITLKERAPKEEVLHTLLLEAELVVNSRPLAYVTDDPANPVVLTPNHLLLGTSSGDAPFTSSDPGDVDARRLWRRANALADDFWRRWRREYLPTLQRRGKYPPHLPR